MFHQRWLRFVIAFTLLIGTIISLGAVCQSTVTARDTALYPAPGELVMVDGYDMHIYCVGEGSPTVIFEAGLGGTYMDWVLVQPSIAEHTRTCAYDRSGMGYSDYANIPLDTGATAERLHHLLNTAHIEGPYILVGHSYGGIHMRTFYGLYPDEVAGMVLVDSAHENQLQRFSEGALKQPFIVEMIYNASPFLARIGVLRGLRLAQQNIVADHLTSEQFARTLVMVNRTDFWKGIKAENQMALDDTNQQTLPPSLGNLPLVVISQDVNLDSSSVGESEDEIVVLWPQLQRELAALSTNSTYIIAERASHYVHYDRPQIVIDGILSILQRLRDR